MLNGFNTGNVFLCIWTPGNIAAVIITAAENSSSSEQKRAGISHREDCWIQTLKIDVALECPWLVLSSNLCQA